MAARSGGRSSTRLSPRPGVKALRLHLGQVLGIARLCDTRAQYERGMEKVTVRVPRRRLPSAALAAGREGSRSAGSPLHQGHIHSRLHAGQHRGTVRALRVGAVPPGGNTGRARAAGEDTTPSLAAGRSPGDRPRSAVARRVPAVATVAPEQRVHATALDSGCAPERIPGTVPPCMFSPSCSH